MPSLLPANYSKCFTLKLGDLESRKQGYLWEPRLLALFRYYLRLGGSLRENED